MRRRHLGKLLVGLHLRDRLGLATPFGRALLCAALAATPAIAQGAGAADGGPGHPLDPLTAIEYRTVFEVLDTAGHAEETTFFPLIQLDEPSKESVLGWKPGDPLKRRSFAVVMKTEGVYEAVIDLTDRRLESWTAIPGAQPGLLLSEDWEAAGRILRAHAPWREALRRRGIDEIDEVVTVPMTVGLSAAPAAPGDRVVKVAAFDGTGVDNYWGRPIEGLVALVSLKSGEVIDLADHGVVAVPDGAVDFDREPAAGRREPPPPIAIAMTQPDGAGYRLDGQTVYWQGWSFHWRVDPRLGVVVSLVRHRDGNRDRSVLYQGSLSEMFVPYTDPGPAWSFRGFLDAGEYGVGRLLAPLEPGLDCPDYATFFNPLLGDEYGNANWTPRAVCLFERSSGDVAWRHHEARTGRAQGRKAVELVLRSAPAVGNYDYILDWVFRLDGSIEVAVGATGVPQVKAVADDADDQRGKAGRWGRRVAPGTVAVDHDHFFSFRLDLDVDGRANSLQIDRLRRVELPAGSPRRSTWRVDPRIARRESEALLDLDLERPALWRVVNPGVTGSQGDRVSYHLAPGANAASLFAADDPFARRAGFVAHHLWVTPYERRERHAAGDYPNQSDGGGGLATWVKRDRPIAGTDIVLWYTLGVHHVTRPEDWPVMPTMWRRFELRPFGFFGRNPSLALED